MINPLKMLGNVASQGKQGMDFLLQARKIQQALEAEEFTVTQGNVKVVISGNQNVKLLEIDGVPNDDAKRAVNDAIKQSQQAAAGKLSEITKNLNM